MRLLIYGSKEFAATVAELARHCGHDVVGMVDDYSMGSNILGSFDVISHSHPPSQYGIAVAVGYKNLLARWSVWEKIKLIGYQSPILIHPRAYVADTAQIGEGAMVMAGAIVDVRVQLGALTVLWPGTCINHDTRVGANTFISPNATLCGFVNVGSHSFVGAGAVIADHCTVPDESFIKMLTRYTLNL
ncbi:hypothetical protein [Chromatium okenii]|jgi:sugar O-acyltransferase (sialic acid O-acetyltransferase NeuD family)|uniref:PglD N-terminal domain-containing protein n=1 Tax=Chromatium okenii TaxID=61644 RepID=A0A2S7XP53_9GAMM|nr:hypothetical protein [Chromatium okenii]MBV5308783.1 hypothetical protein [Chromatium okenii]PQJ95495.1 hypothetical protein CXB77_15060 [Chromatium okenii]